MHGAAHDLPPGRVGHGVLADGQEVAATPAITSRWKTSWSPKTPRAGSGRRSPFTATHPSSHVDGPRAIWTPLPRPTRARSRQLLGSRRPPARRCQCAVEDQHADRSVGADDDEQDHGVVQAAHAGRRAGMVQVMRWATGRSRALTPNRRPAAGATRQHRFGAADVHELLSGRKPAGSAGAVVPALVFPALDLARAVAGALIFF
jgi:hypothetical protein